MAVATQSVTELCRAAKAAARELAALDSATKDRALLAVADALEARTPEILEANARDLEAGRESGLSDALMDRLALDGGRIAGDGARRARDRRAARPGRRGDRRLAVRRTGSQMRKVRVPLGVVAVVYEARPNVTIDAAALCLKSGNAIVLRGSSSAAHSNAVLAGVAREAAEAARAARRRARARGRRRPRGAGRARPRQEGLVDLIIPRGGEGLKKALAGGREGAGDLRGVGQLPRLRRRERRPRDGARRSSSTPRRSARASATRPRRCSSTPTSPPAFLPGALRALADAGVELRGDERVRALAGDVPVGAATEEDYAQEFLALVLAVRVVDSADEAIEHVDDLRLGALRGDRHRRRSARRARSSSASTPPCVYVNASTRFTDGGEFGMGAEIGNSTQKLHARGPIGLRELCTFKYLVEGTGQVRA